jgi:hypothetical protein
MRPHSISSLLPRTMLRWPGSPLFEEQGHLEGALYGVVTEAVIRTVVRRGPGEVRQVPVARLSGET